MSGPRGVRGEWLLPPGASLDAPTDGVVMYVHGGGYVACAVATHRPVTAALARATGWPVFSIDYPRAPEDRFPAALDDAVAAYRWLVDGAASGPPIAVTGESAGGGLVLALAQQARDAGLRAPACVAALSPWTDLAATGASLRNLAGSA